MAKIKQDIKILGYKEIKKHWHFGVIILIIGLGIGSYFLPKNNFQKAKENLDHLALAQEFIKSNQFDRAQKELAYLTDVTDLQRQIDYNDPAKIKLLIPAWEKVIAEKPDYRDGYLHLAYLNYKIFETQKAKDYLRQAINLDPNYQVSRDLEKLIGAAE